jgi:hypothetical protein
MSARRETDIQQEHIYRTSRTSVKVSDDKQCEEPPSLMTSLPLPSEMDPPTLDDLVHCDLNKMSKHTIAKIHEQMIANWTTLDRNTLLFNGIPLGTYCLERIRNEKRRRTRR